MDLYSNKNLEAHPQFAERHTLGFILGCGLVLTSTESKHRKAKEGKISYARMDSGEAHSVLRVPTFRGSEALVRCPH